MQGIFDPDFKCPGCGETNVTVHVLRHTWSCPKCGQTGGVFGNAPENTVDNPEVINYNVDNLEDKYCLLCGSCDVHVLWRNGRHEAECRTCGAVGAVDLWTTATIKTWKVKYWARGVSQVGDIAYAEKEETVTAGDMGQDQI